jgi:hypothetical protein
VAGVPCAHPLVGNSHLDVYRITEALSFLFGDRPLGGILT